MSMLLPPEPPHPPIVEGGFTQSYDLRPESTWDARIAPEEPNAQDESLTQGGNGKDAEGMKESLHAVAVEDDEDEDDFFGDGPAQRVETDFEKLKERYEDAGYREAIEPGKLSTLQAGFDQGFASGVSAARKLGSLRGRTAYLVAMSNRSSEKSVTKFKVIKKKSAGSSGKDVTPQAATASSASDSKDAPSAEAKGSPVPSAHAANAKTLLSLLNRVKAEHIYQPDHEALEHAQNEHPEHVDESATAAKETPVFEVTSMDVPGFEDGLSAREFKLLDALEARVRALENERRDKTIAT